jgi:predicted house-cleaning noncanonical NTP pyrophosphatase (MazG superfamily)
MKKQAATPRQFQRSLPAAIYVPTGFQGWLRGAQHAMPVTSQDCAGSVNESGTDLGIRAAASDQRAVAKDSDAPDASAQVQEGGHAAWMRRHYLAVAAVNQEIPEVSGLHRRVFRYPQALASTIPESVVTAGSQELQMAGRAAMSQGKLVRDKIPQIIRSKGLEPLIYTADSDEYDTRLRDKLREEVEEFIASDSDPEELADVLEVLYALAERAGIDPWQLEKLRMAKAEERGGFADRIIWSGNQPGASLGESAD